MDNKFLKSIIDGMDDLEGTIKTSSRLYDDLTKTERARVKRVLNFPRESDPNFLQSSGQPPFAEMERLLKDKKRKNKKRKDKKRKNKKMVSMETRRSDRPRRKRTPDEMKDAGNYRDKKSIGTYRK